MHTLFESPVTVVEMGDSLAGAFCGRLLGQLGARVIKIEPPGGSPLRDLPPLLPPAEAGTGPRSAPYLAVNAGKEVVTADLEAGQGRDLVESTLAAGGIGIMSGPLQRWAGRGLDPRRLVAEHQSAIVGRVTMFGEEGPYADLIGGELQAQALGGLMNVIGEPPLEPLRIGGFPAQYSAGLAMLSGFALASYRKQATGQGGSFATSVIETVANIEWKCALSYQDDGKIVTRGTDGDPTILRTRDGFFAFYYLQENWPGVLDLMRDPRLESGDFATRKARTANRAELQAIFNEHTSTMSKLDLYRETQARGLPAGYMATMSDLLSSEQYLARGFFTGVDLDGRQGVLPGAPWQLAGLGARSGTDND